MNVSFQGMDELVVTFKAAGGLENIPERNEKH